MLRQHIACQWEGQAARLVCNKCRVVHPRDLTSGSARWLTSHMVGHVAASGLRLSEERMCKEQGSDMCQLRTHARP
jgi:hypothetical protein